MLVQFTGSINSVTTLGGNRVKLNLGRVASGCRSCIFHRPCIMWLQDQ